MTSQVFVPPGTRLVMIERDPITQVWRVWTARSQSEPHYGSFLELHSDGEMTHTTTRANEGDETFVVRPNDRRAL